MLAVQQIGAVRFEREGSIQPMAEEVRGQGQIDDADDRHGPELVDEQREGGAFEERAAQDRQKVAQRVEVGDLLHPRWHVGDGRGKT